MFSIVFFILGCLGPIAVMCENTRWTPVTVPWPAQQCIDHDSKTVGECYIPIDARASYRQIGFCLSLPCALARGDGTHELRRGYGRPLNGTPCGTMQVCKNGACVDIDKDHIPTMTGVRNSFECRPLTAYYPLVGPPRVPYVINAVKHQSRGKVGKPGRPKKNEDKKN